MFAVIKTGGKQYRVSANDVLNVEKIPGDAGDMVEFAQVLMVGDANGTTVGNPVVEGALVTAELVEIGRGRKVISFKKRRRQNSRRTKGHRQWFTTVRIAEILTGGAKPSKTAAKKAAKPEPKAEASAAKEEAPVAKTGKPAKVPKSEHKAEAAASPAATLFTAPAGKGDDLTKIKGIGPVARKQLNEQGLTTFAQLAALTDADIEKIDTNMPFSADQISDWREQAKKLSA